MFTTPAELGELAKRSSTPGRYSATRFSQLAERMARTFVRATTGAPSIQAATLGFFNMHFPMSRKMVKWRKRFALP